MVGYLGKGYDWRINKIRSKVRFLFPSFVDIRKMKIKYESYAFLLAKYKTSSTPLDGTLYYKSLKNMILDKDATCFKQVLNTFLGIILT